jgi:hypothetical protein
MGVTTEPPWLNTSSGIAARNGTNTHVIPFGFTSTPGSFLQIIVYGGVTQVGPGDPWTERLSPINSGELSLFTKDESTGDSSFTVTHNGSNYAVAYAVWEFAEGTVYTGGAQANVSNVNTMPELTGLPGVEQVVFGALGRVNGADTATAASAAWPENWVEDADLFTVFAGNDGCYLTAGHRLNVTTATSTPTVSVSFTGANPVADRQGLTWALDVPAAGQTIEPDGIAVPVTLGSPTVAMVFEGTVAPSGIAVPVALGSPTLVFTEGPPPAPGSWDTLSGIVREARADHARNQERIANPIDCPEHGWPLDGRHCLFGGHVV